MTMEIIKLEPKASCEVDANAIAGRETFITADGARAIYAQEREKERAQAREALFGAITRNCAMPEASLSPRTIYRPPLRARLRRGLKILAANLGMSGSSLHSERLHEDASRQVDPSQDDAGPVQ